MKLHIHVERDEAGYFVAEVPALPGCLSQGKTRDEAVENVREARGIIDKPGLDQSPAPCTGGGLGWG
ncbi:MAG: type II toxin-antitoxin system HicB family antitoxin [Nitrospirae bacterium]|nr:type II toxin-antitoxin system HicB family antitoxin [Nitrospirota bacterium]